MTKPERAGMLIFGFNDESGLFASWLSLNHPEMNLDDDEIYDTKAFWSAIDEYTAFREGVSFTPMLPGIEEEAK